VSYYWKDYDLRSVLRTQSEHFTCYWWQRLALSPVGDKSEPPTRSLRSLRSRSRLQFAFVKAPYATHLLFSKHGFSQSYIMAAQPAVSETSKIPLFYNDKTKDTLPARVWLDRIDQAAGVQNWNDNQKILAASHALRGDAQLWYEVEIKYIDNPTWTVFRDRFLGLTINDEGPYKGGQIWPKILDAHKESSITSSYLKLAKNLIEFNLTHDAHVHNDNYLQPATAASPGIQALTAAERQLITQDAVQYSRNKDMNRTAMSIFFCNMPSNVKNYLLSRPECADLVQMKNQVESFLKKTNNESPVNAVDDVDAIRRRQSTKNAKPDQPRRNITCFYCEKKGHGQQECRKRARDGADMVKPPPRQQQPQQGQRKNKVNETTEVQQVQSSFQSQMSSLNY